MARAGSSRCNAAQTPLVCGKRLVEDVGLKAISDWANVFGRGALVGR